MTIHVLLLVVHYLVTSLTGDTNCLISTLSFFSHKVKVPVSQPRETAGQIIILCI